MHELRRRLQRWKPPCPEADDLAESVNLSVSQMNRRFQAAFGTTPMAYWQDCRSRRAAGLLARSRLAISQVADLCGFQEQNYFSRWFKARHGRTPGEYRRLASREAL
jgi:transcriptional regulator GlxA family with amidase domain